MNVRFVLALLCSGLPAAEQAGRIMRPVDKAAFRSGPVEVIATAPDGTLELDGARVAAAKPFPDVLHAKLDVAPGVHTLALVWQDGRTEIQIYSGNDVPAGFKPFRPHPPASDVRCTQCHELSRRGRFVFKGGCFDCHDNAAFAKTHTHTAEVLEQCGLCHNAHGSTADRHLIHTKELACKQCHN
jgi:predicted CXXCH cytochrome family protein